MQVHEFVDEGLGHSSCVINLGDGTAAVVDPPRFPTGHEALIDRAGWVLHWTIDTHSHADYVTGSPGIAARLGATFIAPAASNLETPHQAIRDGVTFGAGHLPGSISNPVRTVFGSWLGWLGSIPTAPLQSGEPVTVMRGHGERAMSAACLLAARGVATRVFDGGPDTWATATGHALEVGR